MRRSGERRMRFADQNLTLSVNAETGEAFLQHVSRVALEKASSMRATIDPLGGTMKKFLLVLGMWLAMMGAALAQVNINTATKEQLDGLKGIGPTKAQAIVDYRTKNGPFKTVDDLEKVNGIGPATMKDLRSEITVAGGAAKAAKAQPKAEPKAAKKADTKEPAKVDSAKDEKKADAKKDAKAEKKADAKKEVAEKKADAKKAGKADEGKADAKADAKAADKK